MRSHSSLIASDVSEWQALLSLTARIQYPNGLFPLLRHIFHHCLLSSNDNNIAHKQDSNNYRAKYLMIIQMGCVNDKRSYLQTCHKYIDAEQFIDWNLKNINLTELFLYIPDQNKGLAPECGNSSADALVTFLYMAIDRCILLKFQNKSSKHQWEPHFALSVILVSHRHFCHWEPEFNTQMACSPWVRHISHHCLLSSNGNNIDYRTNITQTGIQ